MKNEKLPLVDYGTGQKQLSIYIIGTLACILLTLAAFWAAWSQVFVLWEALMFIYIAAILQFFIQLVCFLRLNLQTLQGKMNIMTFIFTGVILTSIVAGSLWIMFNLNYNVGF